MKVLYIDIGLCSECRGCIEVAPDIFRFNPVAGYMEARDLNEYDEELVREAMKNCPKQCIHYEEQGPGQGADNSHQGNLSKNVEVS